MQEYGVDSWYIQDHMIKSNYAYIIIHYIGMYNPTTTTYYIWDCDGWKSHVDGFLYDIACTMKTGSRIKL